MLGKVFGISGLEHLISSIKEKNIRHPLVLSFLIGLSLLLAVVITKFSLVTGILLLILIAGVPFVYAVVAYPQFGIIAIITVSFFVMLVTKLNISFPLGTVVDALEALLILGFFIKIKQKKEWAIFANPITLFIGIWIFYNMLQALNPNASSYMAWLYTIRSVALIVLTYFIFVLHCRDVKFIKILLGLWLGYALFAALYAAKQEYIGFSSFEAAMLQDERTFKLYFIDGRWRKFSIFSDPVAYAYNMVTASLLCFGLAYGPLQKYKKIILWSAAAFMTFAMLYSGTRGAYVLLPAALVLFAVLNFNRKILIYGSIGAALFAALVVVPVSDPNIKRFQTAFRPSDDASFNVRKINQKKIQPFIRSHAMGGGLGATGVWGARFSPESPLSKFPPDSGYVRVAVELGWIGLLLFCALMFVIIRQGILNYYRIKDPFLKSVCLAMLLVVFALNLGNYPQEAIVQFPSNILFWLATALIHVTWLLDKEKQGKTAVVNA